MAASSTQLAAAVAARFYAVNGRHEMTAEDDAYVSSWYVPLEELAGYEGLPGWFARQWPSPERAVQEWDDYLSGKYVCLRVVSPASMRRKNELVESISSELERPQPESADWLERLHTLVDELDEIEPPFAPYDRLRFGGPVSRDRLIDAVRERFPRRAR